MTLRKRIKRGGLSLNPHPLVSPQPGQDTGTVYQEICVNPRHSQASRDN